MHVQIYSYLYMCMSLCVSLYVCTCNFNLVSVNIGFWIVRLIYRFMEWVFSIFLKTLSRIIYCPESST